MFSLAHSLGPAHPLHFCPLYPTYRVLPGSSLFRAENLKLARLWRPLGCTRVILQIPRPDPTPKGSDSRRVGGAPEHPGF